MTITFTKANFAGRTITHDELTRQIIKDLKAWGYQVIENGREHTAAGVELGDDPGSLILRMRPDIAFVFNRKTCFADAKASRYIERKPYEEYISIIKAGAPVIIIAQYNNETRFCKLQDLHLNPDPCHQIWPVVDGWITPRACPDYQQYKYSYPLTPGKPYHGSGTPYKDFSFDDMLPWGPMYLPWALNNQV